MHILIRIKRPALHSPSDIRISTGKNAKPVGVLKHNEGQLSPVLYRLL